MSSMPVTIATLFANEHFLAVDKPAGWLSVPSRMGPEDTRPCLGTTLQESLGQRLWPVHRLDLEVTGVILFAKGAAAHKRASAWFEQRLVRKTYQALSESSEVDAKRYTTGHTAMWRSRLLRGKKRAYESPQGKPTATEARVLEVLPTPPRLLWELHPITGRAHQLRFELAKHGAPIVGDTLYGAKSELSTGAIALRCVELDFSACDAASLGLSTKIRASDLTSWIEAYAVRERIPL